MLRFSVICLLLFGLTPVKLCAVDAPNEFITRVTGDLFDFANKPPSNYDDALVWSAPKPVIPFTNDPEIYSEVEVVFEDMPAIESFLKLGLDLDHFHPELGVNRVLLPKKELQILRTVSLSG